GMPGGPNVEQAARGGDARRFALPRPMHGRSEPNFSFAGLKTAVRLAAEALVPLTQRDIADLCASFETAAIGSVIDRTARAMEIAARAVAARDGGTPVLVVAGGVAANRRLRDGLD